MIAVSDQFREAIFVGGRWTPPATTEAIDVVNPATEQSIGSVPAGSAADVDAAVAAARDAFGAWSTTMPEERAGHLAAIRDGLAARAKEAAELVTAELGAPLMLSQRLHVKLPQTVLGSYVELLRDYPFRDQIGNSVVHALPVGVVGAITPWNYPLHQVVAKVAAALAAGCTVVLKPAEDTPLIAYLFAEVCAAAGLPAGVLNVVSGRGPVAGSALVEHPDVDMISFTGSTAVGRQIGASASGALKRVALELGGKSANVILPGADLGRAVKVGVGNALLNSGQTCSAWTRMLVHGDQYDEAVSLAVAAASKYTTGDPLDLATRLGPLVADRQRTRVRGYIDAGVAEGAHLATGGAEPPQDTGFFVAPTVFAEVTPQMRIAQEEIFGPVLSILRYADEDEAVEIANGTPYGLAGGVWAADNDTASAFARRIRTGQVDINGGAFNPVAPFGGFKASGLGRELGPHGLAEFLQLQSQQF
jgi:aldehyde dehydrogenase (NAD+)